MLCEASCPEFLWCNLIAVGLLGQRVTAFHIKTQQGEEGRLRTVCENLKIKPGHSCCGAGSFTLCKCCVTFPMLQGWQELGRNNRMDESSPCAAHRRRLNLV